MLLTSATLLLRISLSPLFPGSTRIPTRTPTTSAGTSRPHDSFVAYKTPPPTLSLVLLFQHPSATSKTPTTRSRPARARETKTRSGGNGIFGARVEGESDGSKDMAVMVDNYVAGTLLAFLLGFVVVYILRRKTTAEKDERGERRAEGGGFDEIRNDCVRSSTDGEVRPEGGPETDVVIVGAGVAGAALAHTLGKVRSSFFLFLIPYLRNFFPRKIAKLPGTELEYELLLLVFFFFPLREKIFEERKHPVQRGNFSGN